MTGTLRVLAIGSKDALDLVQNALRFRRRSHLLVASNYWELCSLSIDDRHQVSAAVIEVSTSDRDLLRTAEHIRRRWPDAQILLMGREAKVLADPLYDERIPPGLEAAELLPAVERLVKRKQRSKRARKHDSKIGNPEWG